MVHRVINDPRAISRIDVRVDIRHPHPADLQITLISPEGQRILLRRKDTPGGPDLQATFGLDTIPAEPLDVLEGQSAAGDWSLQIVDLVPGGDPGSLSTWSLVLGFAGAEPLADRPTSGTDSIFFPVVGHVTGARNTRFATDVHLFNRTSIRRDVILIFTPTGASDPTDFRAVSISIDPGRTVELNDLVRRDLLYSGIGTLELLSAKDAVIATGRTYDDHAGATSGQNVPAVSIAGTVGAESGPMVITQLRNTDSFRSNLGFAELGGAGGGIVEVRLYDGAGNLLDSRQIPISAHSHVQIPVLGGIGGSVADRVRAEIRVISGEARIFAYGSTIDNASGDPVFIPGVRTDQVTAESRIPVAARTDGLRSTRWKTDLWLANPGADVAPVVLNWIPGEGGALRTATVDVPPRGTVLVNDALASLFDLTEGAGQISVEGAVIATSRTWTPGSSGTLGQFIPARGPNEATIGDQVITAIGAEVSNHYRTNIGLSETTGQPVTVRVRVLNSANEIVSSRVVSVKPNRFVQLGLEQLGAGLLGNGRVTAQVIEGTGRIFGYISIIDNQSGDPTWIPMQ